MSTVRSHSTKLTITELLRDFHDQFDQKPLEVDVKPLLKKLAERNKELAEKNERNKKEVSACQSFWINKNVVKVAGGAQFLLNLLTVIATMLAVLSNDQAQTQTRLSLAFALLAAAWTLPVLQCQQKLADAQAEFVKKEQEKRDEQIEQLVIISVFLQAYDKYCKDKSKDQFHTCLKKRQELDTNSKYHRSLPKIEELVPVLVQALPEDNPLTKVVQEAVKQLYEIQEGKDSPKSRQIRLTQMSKFNPDEREDGEAELKVSSDVVSESVTKKDYIEIHKDPSGTNVFANLKSKFEACWRIIDDFCGLQLSHLDIYGSKIERDFKRVESYSDLAQLEKKPSERPLNIPVITGNDGPDEIIVDDLMTMTSRSKGSNIQLVTLSEPINAGEKVMLRVMQDDSDSDNDHSTSGSFVEIPNNPESQTANVL